MNPFLIPALVAAIAFCPCASLAKAGSEIPRPKLPAAEAIAKVKNYFQRHYESEPRDPKFDAYKRECIVLSVQYTNTYYRDFSDPTRFVDLGEWSWVITLDHPRQNDHSWTFHLRRDGTFKLLSHSV